MRISDWSSDVCSSDLFVDDAMGSGDRLLVDIPEGDRLLEMRPAQDDAVVDDDKAPGEAAHRAGDLQHPEPADRKSVVQGKSVSVRVDLGGSRILKQKKPHPYYHKLTNTPSIEQ